MRLVNTAQLCAQGKKKPTTIEWVKHNTVVSKEKIWLYYFCNFLYVVNVPNMIACCAHNLTVKIIIAVKLNNAAVCLHVPMIKGQKIRSLGRFSIYSMMMLSLLINAVLALALDVFILYFCKFDLLSPFYIHPVPFLVTNLLLWVCHQSRRILDIFLSILFDLV